MENRRITPLTTAGCFAAIMVLFALLSTFFPFFSFIGYFIMPIPMAIIYMKYGLRQTILLGVTAGVLMGVFLDPLTALFQILTFGAVGVALGAGFRHQWPPVKLLGVVTVSLVLLFVLLGILTYAVLGVNLLDQFAAAFSTFTETMLAQYQAQGMSEVQLAETKAQFNQVREILPGILPMFICLGMAIIAYLNVKVTQVVLQRLGFSVRPFLPIRYWEIPRSMIYLYILALVMKYWGTTRDLAWLNILGINLNQIAFFFICIQGISFVLYLLSTRFHLKNGIQALIILLFFLMPAFAYGAFLAGIFDMLTNFRKKGRTI